MTQGYNSPTQLNTFTSVQGRKFKGSLNKQLREAFVRRFVETTTAKRKERNHADRLRAGELLRFLAISETGLTVEYFDALPKTLFAQQRCIELSREYLDPSINLRNAGYRNFSCAFPDGTTMPNNILRYDRSDAKYPEKTPAQKEAVAELKLLIDNIVRYHIDHRQLQQHVEKKTEECRSIRQLTEVFISAEDYFDDAFYAADPGTPMLGSVLRAELSKWAA